MRIFKFGGASVKDADGIRNVYDVLQKIGYEDVFLVVSAMGKTTNALEVVIKNYFEKSACFAIFCSGSKKIPQSDFTGFI